MKDEFMAKCLTKVLKLFLKPRSYKLKISPKEKLIPGLYINKKLHETHINSEISF